MAHVFGLSPKSPAARLVCGERPGGESCHTVLALSGPLPSGVRPGPDVTRRGVSAGPAVWVKAVEAVRPFPSPPSNTAEDGKCPPSRFDNAVFSWPWTAQSPILAINWSFIGESAMGARRQAGERQSAPSCERVSSEREKIVWPLLRRPLPAARWPHAKPISVALADPTPARRPPAAWISTADKPKDEHHVAARVCTILHAWEVGTALPTHIRSPQVERPTTTTLLSAPSEYRYHRLLPRQHERTPIQGHLGGPV